MARTERRSTKRVPAKYEINFIHEGDYLISFSKDISVDGMFIQTIGELNEVSVEAKVVWVNDVESTKDAGMGVQFVNPPDHLKENILRVVKRVAVLEREGVA
jgi:Tfp pilus assembly protein PilZ